MILKIGAGELKGRMDGNMIAFLGIPYAEPPVGERRFKPPVKKKGWKGVLDCTAFGPRAMQPRALNPEPGVVYSEDCLNLNVWTPALDGKKRPVVFYIHGGGHVEGSNSEEGFDGPSITQGHDVVVVMPNYRLGAFGYLYLGKLLGEDYAMSGNLGLTDQILALEWVQEHIEAFGGDPQNVCIIGQSAGGKSVLNLMMAPAAKGLFHSAFAMSGALQSIKDIETVNALALNFLDALNIPSQNAASILDASPLEIIKAQLTAHSKYIMFESYGTTADGIVLPKDVSASVMKREIHDVPLVMGYMEKELHINTSLPYNVLSDDDVERRLLWKFGDNGNYIFKEYLRLKATHGYVEALGKVSSYYTYINAYLHTASLLLKSGYRSPIFLYRWAFGGAGIACHSTDNEALFRRTQPDKKVGFEQTWSEMERIFHQSVMQFIKTKNPSTKDMPPWPSAQQNSQMQMVIDMPPRLEPIDVSRYDTNLPLSTMVVTRP